MIITSTTLLGLAIMTPIMKCYGFSRFTGNGLTKICALYQNIFNLETLQFSLEKTLKNTDFKSTITPLLGLLFNFFFVNLGIFLEEFKFYTKSFKNRPECCCPFFP
jgi:hypothetical protein